MPKNRLRGLLGSSIAGVLDIRKKDIDSKNNSIGYIIAGKGISLSNS